MTRIQQSLLWAVAILVVALVSKMNDLNGSVSFALVMGLTAAAWASINRGGSACGKRVS